MIHFDSPMSKETGFTTMAGAVVADAIVESAEKWRHMDVKY